MIAITKPQKSHAAANKCCGWEEVAICISYCMSDIWQQSDAMHLFAIVNTSCDKGDETEDYISNNILSKFPNVFFSFEQFIIHLSWSNPHSEYWSRCIDQL
jgi:hypothetical protein